MRRYNPPRPCTGIAWNKRHERYWAYRPLANGGRKSLGYRRTREEAEALVAADKAKQQPQPEREPTVELSHVKSLARERVAAFLSSLDRQFSEAE